MYHFFPQIICYVGVTDTLNFTNWYRQENEIYNVEALLEISYEPFPTPTSTTTSKLINIDF